MALTDSDLEQMRKSRPHAGDLAVVSMHEKGFPQADLYVLANADDDLEGETPDDFFTMKRGDTIEMACGRAKEKWFGATVVIAEDD